MQSFPAGNTEVMYKFCISITLKNEIRVVNLLVITQSVAVCMIVMSFYCYFSIFWYSSLK